MYRLIVNAYVDPDARRDAELVEAARINCDIFDDVCSVSGRPTFAELFAEANRITGENDINVVANSDISFDWTLRFADEHLDGGCCWALSRDDLHRSDSQDAWVFRGPIRIPNGCDFCPGIPGCDNRLAHLLWLAGYQVINPCLTVTIKHHHATGIRRYVRRVDVVRGPYRRVEPQHLSPRKATSQ